MQIETESKRKQWKGNSDSQKFTKSKKWEMKFPSKNENKDKIE